MLYISINVRANSIGIGEMTNMAYNRKSQGGGLLFEEKISGLVRKIHRTGD